jgi:deoxyhypusine monooxygenase
MTLDPIPELRRILTDDASPNLALRFRALFSLKHLATQGNTAAIDAIAAGFASNSALLKHELAYCLGQSKQFYAAAPLQAVLSNEAEDPMVRHEAGEALGALGHVPSLDLLRKYAGDKEETVAQTCELAIARIEWEASGAAKTEQLQQSAFASIDPAPPLPGTEKEVDCTKLQQKLNDQELPLFERYRAMFRLRDIATPAAIDALASGLDDPSALFRHEVGFHDCRYDVINADVLLDCLRIRSTFRPALYPCTDQSCR